MKIAKDSLGDRIKRYEGVFNHHLVPRSPVFIRIDGKAFHTFTKGCNKPFDKTLVDAMVYAAQMTAKEIGGFKLAYVQSDEATFMLTDFDELDTQGWFDYEVNKIVSISASAFTAHFNHYWTIHCTLQHDDFGNKKPAMFDSRAFNVPLEDAANVFIWRQRDWERNSIQMLARSVFSHKECEGKKVPDLHELLYTKGINWAELSPQYKNGTWVLRDGSLEFNKADYTNIMEKITKVKDI